MDNSSTNHDPIYYDESGCYITEDQLRFFINREKGREKFVGGSEEFTDYFLACRTYNLISDLIDKDPTCAQMYWDDYFESAVFSFPAGGSVASRLSQMGISYPNIN